uniref:Plasmid replication protein origin binding domain-containing protein n=1 Tax=uncultured prokaryote TaxID=198431 RepID=A0A0H5Q0X0_9ZZZZ|nr:hypothetical protein [uncultured prokaryote]
MPYKDMDKRREAERRSKEKAREKKKAAEAEAKSGPNGTDPAPPPGAKTIPANKKDVKKRNWWFVLYPESAPPDWRDRLRATGLPIAISPLHDKDVYDNGEQAGQPKKPHHHVILAYPGPTTYSVVCKLVQGELGQPIPQPLEAIRGGYRYLSHADNPEKYQYDAKDIETLNGFNILDYVDMTAAEAVAMNKELVSLIMELGFADYCDFIEYLLFNGTDVQYEYAISHTLFFTAYLKSRWQREKAIREAEEKRQQEKEDRQKLSNGVDDTQAVGLSSDSTLAPKGPGST